MSNQSLHMLLVAILCLVIEAFTASPDDQMSTSSLPFDLRAVARLTSVDLKSLLNDELGVHKMQFIVDMLASQSEAVVRERRVSFLSRKLTERINDYAKLVQNSEQLEVRLRQDLSSFLNESETNDPEFTRKTRLETPSFVYHRLDLISSPPKLCKYFKQLATLDASSLFLSGNAFDRQTDHQSLETDATIQQLTKYLSECSIKVPNPGLRPRVREDVMAISRISSTWKERSKTGNLSKYVVRRYMATDSGVFLMYPGAAIDRSYHPHHRDWYRNAIANPGRVILTAPYLDVGGSGYIVTLSTVIREGRVSKSQPENVLGVMGMDFTLGYFHKLLMQSMTSCRQQNITCFLMDDRGYLLAHASLIEPSGRGPVEYTHITHKEPLVANDLLNHKFFMKKQVCSSHLDCTIQRFYSLNMSMNSVLTNLVHGEHCSKYQITSIPESNIFVGIINKTCDTMTAFCPCSVVDRLCLNCHRMEQTDCECPCECPLETCPSVYSEEAVNQDSSCSPSAPVPQDLQLPIMEFRSDVDVASCFQVDCSTRVDESDCQGVLGCEWCQVDMTGQALDRKFCNFQRRCFGGVLGVRSPYADELSETIMSEVPFSRVTPFTSIIFVLVTCVVLLSLVVYCYRFHVQRAACVLYVQNMRDGDVRMSQLDNDMDETRDSCQKPISNAGSLLANIEAAAVVSPYRLNPGYRRPAAGGGADSDNGYSTMTVQEDSEHLGPDPLHVGKTLPASITSISSTSRTSSPVDATSSALKSPPITTSAAAQTSFHSSISTQAQVHRLVDPSQ